MNIKKQLIFLLFTLSPFVQAGPKELINIIKLTTELNQAKNEVYDAQCKEYACYICGSCTEIATCSFAHAMTQPGSAPASPFLGLLFGCLGYGFTHTVSYPLSKNAHKEALDAQQKITAIESQLKPLPAVIMISYPARKARLR